MQKDRPPPRAPPAFLLAERDLRFDRLAGGLRDPDGQRPASHLDSRPFGSDCLCHASADQAEGNCVDVHAVSAPFAGKGPGEADDARLRGGVVRLARIAPIPATDETLTTFL